MTMMLINLFTPILFL